MPEDSFLKGATELWDSFGTFRANRNTNRLLRERDPSQEPDLGKPKHDVGLRYMSWEPQHESNQYSAVLDTASLTYGFRARSTVQKIKDDAQIAERWTNRVIPLLGRGPLQPLMLSRSYRVCDGVSIWKWDLSESWLKAKPGRGRTFEQMRLQMGLPFVWSAPDPLTHAWFIDQDGRGTVLERSERLINPILRSFPDKFKWDGNSLRTLGPGEEPDTYATTMKTVLFTQITTDDEIRYYVNKDGGKDDASQIHFETIANPWGRLPYQIIAARLQSGSTDPDKLYRPLIEGALATARYDNFAESLTLLAARLTAVPCYDLFMKSTNEMMALADPDTGVPKGIELDPDTGIAMILPPGSELRQRTIQMGADMDKLRDRIFRDMERFGFPTGLTGAAPEPRTTAWGSAEAAERAILHIDPARQNEEVGLVDAAKMLCSVVKNYIKADVPILEVVVDDKGVENQEIHHIRPENIHEFDIKVGVTIPNSSMQFARQEAYRQEVEAGRYPEENFQEHELGLKDVAKARRTIRLERLQKRADPWIDHLVLERQRRKIERETGKPIPLFGPDGEVLAEVEPTRAAGGQVRNPMGAAERKTQTAAREA